MNKEIFYCSLDQFDNSNDIINNWTNFKKDCTIKLKIKNPELPLINFDRFKGSFLSIKNKTTLNITAEKDDLVFKNDTITANVFLNTNIIGNNDQNNFVLFEYIVDEYLIKYYLVKKEGQERVAQICIDCRSTDEEISDVVTSQNTGIEINYDYWYNFNLNISKNGIFNFSVININSILSTSEETSDNFNGNYELNLNEMLENKDINFREIHSIIFGAEGNNGEFDISDFYLFRDITDEELNIYIEKGVNVSSKYTYRTKMNFELFTLFDDEEHKGIHIIDRKNEKYILRLLLNNYSITKRDENSQIILKLKKGFFKITSEEAEILNITEEKDELYILFDINDAQLDYELPHIRFVNVTNNDKMFVQCELLGITVFENNNPVEVCDHLPIDNLITIKDISKKKTVPFDCMVLGEQSYEVDGVNEISLQLNLINISGNDLKFHHDEAFGSKGRLKLQSLFWNQLIPRDSISTIKIDTKIIEDNSIYDGEKFVFKCDHDEVYIETNAVFTIKQNAIIRLKIYGLKINNLSELIPAGAYPFNIKFENIEDYNDGNIPFSLNFKSKQETSLPVGSIIAFYGKEIPKNWLLCDGQSIDSILYPDLYNILPSKTTPDLRDRFLVGAGRNYSLGNTGGNDYVTLEIAQLPNHTHHVKGIQSDYEPFKDTDLGWTMREEMHGIYGTDRLIYYRKNNNYPNKFFTTTKSTPIQSVGDGKSHENRPPYHAVNYIIKAK